MDASPPNRLSGRATLDGTRREAAAHPADPGFYRTWNGLTLSSIGLGTYLGDVGPAANDAYEASATAALSLGVNVLDTAINYRDQQSERDVGRALAAHGRRDGILVATKGGFLPLDASARDDPRGYIEREYLDSGLVKPNDVARGVHCMSPAFLENQLGRSLTNLGLEAVDVYFVHNPETQLNAGIGRAEFEKRIRAAFEGLEAACDEGRIGVYGVATWDALREPPEAANHVSLERLIGLAEEAHSAAGGRSRRHRFGALELPVNIAMVEAVTAPTQSWDGDVVPVLEAAADADLLVLASASLLQGRLLGRLPPFVRQVLGAQDDVQAALEFARSAPGVTTALVGMGRPEHARANVSAMAKKPPTPDAPLKLLTASA